MFGGDALSEVHLGLCVESERTSARQQGLGEDRGGHAECGQGRDDSREPGGSGTG